MISSNVSPIPSKMADIKDLFTSSFFSAPKYRAMIMENPVVVPDRNPTSNDCNGEALPTAASAFSPNAYPTIFVSIRLYRICNALHKKIGIAKVRISFAGFPTVRSTAFPNFLIYVLSPGSRPRIAQGVTKQNHVLLLFLFYDCFYYSYLLYRCLK